MRTEFALLLAAGLLASCAAQTPPPAPASVARVLPPAVAAPMARPGVSLAQLALAAPAYRPAAFGSVEAPLAPDGAAAEANILRQWERVLAWLRTRGSAWRDCALGVAACRSAPEQAWRELIASARGLPPEQQLDRINRAVNRTPYVDDARRDGAPDHWATPEEFLLDAGDCEDFAIAKYVALRHLGFRAETLRIVVLTDSIRGQVHAVLAFGAPGNMVILDSLSNELFPDALYAHYVPHLSVNELGRWEHFGRTVVPLAGLPAGPGG